MYKIDNKLFCRDSNSDTTVFLDNNKNVINGYMLSYGKYKIPSSVKHNRHWEVEGDYFFADRVMESENYLFIEGIYQAKYARNILYNKRNYISKNVVFNYEFHDRGFHNDLDGGIPFWPKGVVAKNILYDHISPIQLKRLMDHEYYKNIPIKNMKQNQLLKQLLQDCEITDNPIIFKLFLK